jgi:hypothetical protein
LYMDHHFFSSWCIVFILGHNNPLGQDLSVDHTDFDLHP